MLRIILVRSRSDPMVPHIVDVDMDRGMMHCTCAGYQFRGTCRHIDEALEIMERE